MRQVKLSAYHNFWFILTLLLHLQHFSFSQISGIVEDTKSRKPIAGVEVFVNQSSIFGVSDVDGTFKLNTPPYGFINLVLYKEGYELYHANMRVQPGRAYTLSLSLSPKGKRDEPTKMAVADNIETGYRKITYYIKSPASSDIVRYQRLSTNGLSQTVNWETKCKELYEGSLHHWLKAMVSGKAEEAGFEMSVAGRVVSGKSFINTTSLPGYYRLSFPNSVEVRYKNSINRLTATGALDVSEQGVLLNPKLLAVEGPMKLIDLPVDYEPIEGKVDDVFAEAMKRYYEKIYVHTDKPYYYQGEPMWFKVYINYYYPQWRDSLSKVLYVELISPSKEIVLEKMLKIDSGYAAGDFILPDTLKQGNYFLRAYTNLQRNFDDDKLYVRQIPVLGITDKVDPLQAEWKPQQNARLQIIPDKKVYHTKEKITLTIAVNDKNNNPLKADLSISVTDASQVVPIRTERIIDHYQIDRDGIVVPQVFNYQPEKSISLRGSYFNEHGKPIKTQLNLLQWKPRNMSLLETDNNGHFEFSGFEFYDSVRFFFKSGGVKKERGNIVLENRDRPVAKMIESQGDSLKLLNTNSPQRIFSEYEVPRGARILEDVTIRDKRIEESTQSSYGRPDAIIKRDQLKMAYSNVLYSLVGAVPGLVVVPGETGGLVSFTRSAGLSIENSGNVLIMLNDVPMGGDPGVSLSLINPARVDRIEITKRINVLYGSQGVNGVISVYTKKDFGEEVIPDPNFKYFNAKGFSPLREYISPDDSNKDKQIDFRSGIYWNPNIVTNSLDGHAQISFYTTDVESTYHVVVEGVTSENEPVRAEYFIEVKN